MSKPMCQTCKTCEAIFMVTSLDDFKSLLTCVECLRLITSGIDPTEVKESK